MTVVVWDGKTMAADKRASNCGSHYAVTKIRRIDDMLVGISGHLGHGLAVCEWLKNGRTPGGYPEVKGGDENKSYCLVVHRDGLIERFEGVPFPIVVNEPVHVLGGARDFALAALHLGCDAQRAVEITCALSTECGNGIDTLSFDPP